MTNLSPDPNTVPTLNDVTTRSVKTVEPNKNSDSKNQDVLSTKKTN